MTSGHRRPALPAAAVALLIVAAATLAGCAGQPDAAPRPNILFVLYDDLDFIGDLEPYGADAAEVQTPFARLLAAEGRRFERFYVNAPVCSPTRVSLLSGLYPTSLGFTWATEETSRRGLPTSTPTLPRLLGGRGYLTGAFGKWHIGSSQDALLPAGAGFDRSAINCTYTNLGSGSTAGPDPGADYREALFCDRPGHTLPDSGRSFATTYTVDKALDFIAEALDAPPGSPPGVGAKPFYAQLWLHAPHTPLTCPPGAADCPKCATAGCNRDEKRRIHHAMVSHAETQLMRLRHDLEERGVWGETLVILASDNGGVAGWNEPSTALRGAKGSLHERGLRTPLLVAGPGVDPGVDGSVISGHDLLPTLAERLDLPFEGPGLSFADRLWPSVEDRSAARADRALFWLLRPRADFDQHTLAGRWRRYAVRKRVDGRVYKLVKNDLWAGGAEPQLFDLESDPAETRDRASKRPRVRNHLLTEWRHWRLKTGAIRPQVDMPIRLGGEEQDRPRRLEIAEHPALTVGRLDFSVSFSITPDPQPAATSWVMGHDGAWSIRLHKGRLAFAFGGRRPHRIEHPTVLQADKTYRVTATLENRRGLALVVDDQAARARVRFGAVPHVEGPIHLGPGPGGDAAFAGTVDDLIFFPLALDAEDLLGLGHAGGEGPQPTSEGLRHTFPLDGADAAAEVLIGVRLRTAGGESATHGVDLTLECLRDGQAGWHPRSTSTAPHFAIPDWRRITHRHVCPRGTDAVRVAAKADGGFDWQALHFARLGTSVLDVGFEPGDDPLFSNDEFERVAEAKTGSYGLQLPAGSSTPELTLPISGAEGLEASLWAKTSGPDDASLRLQLRCLDEDGRALKVPTGSPPDRRSAISSPGRVDDAWRLFRLVFSCPREPATAAVGLTLDATGSAIVLDDLTLVVP